MPMHTLNLLVSAAAFAQDFAPAPAPTHVLGVDRALPEGATVYTVGGLVNLRGEPAADAPVVRRLLTGTRVVVTEDRGGWVEVSVAGAAVGWVARPLLTTMGRVADLDGDGVEERIVVAQGEDGQTRAWLREGARVQQTVLHPWPDPYLASWALVPADEAGVALVRVDLNQDSCGAYPSVWLSYAGDTLRTALTVEPWADGGYGESYDVRFVAPGRVSVRQETYGELEPTYREQACLLTEGVFHCS